MDRFSPDKVDAVIVGAGAAGSYFAARLAEAGKSVVVLEAGPGWETKDLISSGIWGRRLKGHAGHVERDGANPWGYSFNVGYGLGGAALHHYAVWPRLAPEDFRMKSLYGKGFDWPVSYDDLRPWYDQIQSEVGLAGDAEAEVWRGPGDPYPMPPHPVMPGAAVVKRGFDKLGIRTAPIPLAINSIEYDGRTSCIYDSWCDAGCPIGALANPLVTHIPRARRAGAEFRTGANVTRALTDAKERVSGVEYFDSSGERVELMADLVIIAGAPIESPRLLLNSASRHHPQGIGNDRDLVGRFFMGHPMAGIHGLFPDETQPFAGTPGGSLTSRDDYAKDRGDGPFGSYSWAFCPGMKPNDLGGFANVRPGLFGRALDEFMKKAANHYARMVAFGEELPRAENRISLGEKKDAFGYPVARITHSSDADTIALWNYFRTKGLEIFEAAGADQAWDQQMLFAHALGGTIMGHSPEDSVTDSYGRVHGVQNLLVAGSGLFPTSGGVNPTYTIYALAARTVDNLLEHWSDYAG